VRIGPVELSGDTALAPMAAVTNAPFRQLCREHGCSITVTEMVASEALVRGVGRNELRMERAPGETPLIVQLFGGKPDTMAEAARIAVEEAGAEIVDINMGCPVRKILGSGAGVALMREPDRAAAIVRAMVQAVGDRVPVTVKIRAGWDEESMNAPEFAKQLEGAGAAAIAIHARTKEQVHSGAARWEVIAAVKRAVSVPVMGNGGIATIDDVRRMKAETGCDVVMLGRAAHGNPWIFRSLLAGRDLPPTTAERFAAVRRHLDLYIAWAGEGTAVREMRKHLAWYLRGMPNCAELRMKMQRMTSAAVIRSILEEYERDVAGAETAAPAEPPVEA
jgi:tRNA-dihydrouridine synthase B